ncbi:hypothetical protein KAR91_23175 [Candidatus Pacearchaeota archaeon]|nr:hypothetical protein [Candidatus Pacearchaeota archaeon]
MDIDEARNNIGKMVMSIDAGYKLIHSVGKPHGPYKLLKITKAGYAILKGREEHRIAPSLLSVFEDIDHIGG